ncbi:MAG: hypothetical protein B6I38_07005, partial [Anaerolineaceae bacterium 4572_5.1]
SHQFRDRICFRLWSVVFGNSFSLVCRRSLVWSYWYTPRLYKFSQKQFPRYGREKNLILVEFFRRYVIQLDFYILHTSDSIIIKNRYTTTTDKIENDFQV